MDFFIERDALSRHLARVQSIAERRATQAILSHVLIDAQTDGVHLAATDTEISFTGFIQTNVKKTGSIAVEAASLFQIVRTLNQGAIRFSTGAGQRLEISCGSSRFKIPGVSGDEFPELPSFDMQSSITVNEVDFRKLVDQTHFAVSTDDGRFGLNGTHLEVVQLGGEDTLRMVSTDGHRLCAAHADFSGELNVPPGMLIPRKALLVIRKLLENKAEPISVQFSLGSVQVKKHDQTFWFRLLEGKFPQYHSLVPTDCKHRATFSKSALNTCLKRVAILVSERARPVRFGFDDGEVQIGIQNADKGEVHESLPIELQGGAITVGFNIRYLQDIIGVIGGKEIIFELAHPLGPCLIHSPDEPNSFFIVMPMRLD